MIARRPGGGRGLVEPRRAVDAVAIEERHGRVAEIGGAIDDRFRERRALQKAEGGGGVELDVREDTFSPQRTLRTRRQKHVGTCSFVSFVSFVVQSTIASMNHPSVSRSRKTRYTAPSASPTSHSSRSHEGRKGGTGWQSASASRCSVPALPATSCSCPCPPAHHSPTCATGRPRSAPLRRQSRGGRS